MNKTELIQHIANTNEMTVKNAAAAVDAVLGAITEALAAKESVNIVGFGSFEVKKRAARQGHNPKTKEVIKIPDSMVPAFRPGKALKDAVK